MCWVTRFVICYVICYRIICYVISHFIICYVIMCYVIILVSQKCLPHLLDSKEAGRNPHILNNSPPLDMRPIWFQGHVAYSMAKYNMSLCALGMAAEFQDKGTYIQKIQTLAWILNPSKNNIGFSCRELHVAENSNLDSSNGDAWW